MKINDIKHNHSLTDLLKVILFSIIMILPFLSVATRCLYVVCNKNAKESYSDNTTEIVYINNSSNIDVNTEYYLQNGYKNDLVALPGNASTNILRFNIIEVIDNPNNYNFNNVIDVGFYSPSTTNTNVGYYFHYSDNTQTLTVASNNVFKIKIQITNTTTDFDNSIEYMNILYKNGNENSLDNVFEYSVSKLQENNLFNWTQNTAIYTGVKAMTDNLQITITVIPMILTYWFLITVIYVIIDLILKSFTALTHMIIKKT